MSNTKKLLKRIMESQKPPNDIMPREFLSLATSLGLEIRQGTGSHVIIYDPSDPLKWHMTVAVGHPEPIDPKAIKELKSWLENRE